MAKRKVDDRMVGGTAEDNQKAFQRLVISAPNFVTAEFRLKGTAPYVQNKFSQKMREKMKAAQMAGAQARKGSKREPKDFQALFEGASHRGGDGRYGIPAGSFRNAMISACRMVGFKMTHAKLAIFIDADFLDADEGIPLVALDAGEPEHHEACVRNESGVADIRARPMWREWGCNLRVRFDADQFSLTDVANLLSRAGFGGIGEGRPDSKNSAGMGWGTFTIES